jgi:hypothetical protein
MLGQERRHIARIGVEGRCGNIDCILSPALDERTQGIADAASGTHPIHVRSGRTYFWEYLATIHMAQSGTGIPAHGIVDAHLALKVLVKLLSAQFSFHLGKLMPECSTLFQLAFL